MKNKLRLWSMANLITLVRILLVFIAVYLLFHGVNEKVIALFAILLAIFMDLLDGYFARKFNMTSEFGSIFDIVADRIVENVLWIAFTILALVPVWVPIVILTRGLITDFIRGYALSKGLTAFGQKTMIRGVIGKLVVCSDISRFLYAVFKVVSFELLTLILILREMPNYANYLPKITAITNLAVYCTVIFCLVRAIPVIYDGWELFIKNGKI